MFLVGIASGDKNHSVIDLLKPILSKNNIKVAFAYLNSKNKISLSEYKSAVPCHTELLIVCLNSQTIELCSDCSFDLVLLGSGNNCDIKEVLNRNSILVLNDDNSGGVWENCKFHIAYIITYGLNSKSTITASSICEAIDCFEFTYCLQREIKTLNDSTVFPQEFPVIFDSAKDFDIYSALAAITILMLTELA